VPTVVANGVRLNYEQTGRGPDVVMVHGLATNLAFWYLKSVPLLRDAFRITAYDLRGHGRSEMPPTGYTPTVMADDLDALLEVLGTGRVHLVGHSYGAVVALELALRAPERLASLTLVDARLDAFQPPLRLKDWPHFETWKKRLERANARVPDENADADYQLLMYEPLIDAAPEPVRPTALAVSRSLPARGGRGRAGQQWMRLLETTTAKADFGARGPSLERVRHLVTPCLAVFGALSHCLPTCVGLRSAVRCHEVILPEAGHFFPLTRPRVFAAIVREFLLRMARRDGTSTNGYGAAASIV
jgi:pimeloyl-ACP methyl ester carboxylesterase